MKHKQLFQIHTKITRGFCSLRVAIICCDKYQQCGGFQKIVCRSTK